MTKKKKKTQPKKGTITRIADRKIRGVIRKVKITKESGKKEQVRVLNKKKPYHRQIKSTIALFHNKTRSNRAKTMDRKKTSSKVITDDRWIKNPRKFDYPNVDTKPGYDFLENKKKNTSNNPKTNKQKTQKEKWAERAKLNRQRAKANEEKIKELRAQNKKHFERIEPGQPVMSRRDRNYRQRGINQNKKIHELQKKVEAQKSHAANLEDMATRKKGDAKKEYDQISAYRRSKYKVGDTVFHLLNRRNVKIVKINKKTIKILDKGYGTENTEPYMLEDKH